METDFLPAEWTCLFPGPTPPFQPLLRVAPPDSPADNNNGPGASAAAEAPESDDPGASFRAANPLTFDAMMATLTSPFLRVIAFLGASPRFSFIGWRVAAQDTLTFALILALLGLAWSWNDGTFGTKQLVLGFVSAALFLLVMAGSLWLNAIAVPQVPKLLDFAAPAVLCRWLQLTNGGGPAPGEKPTMAEDAPRLVRHENGDAMCPCTDCVGNVQLLAGVLCALDLFFLGCLGTLVSWTTAWTAVVTFGARLWSIWWGYLLGALYAFAALGQVHNNVLRFVFVSNLAYAKLEERLHHRAVVISMRSMASRVVREKDDRQDSRSPWLYVRLHHGFAALCKARAGQDQLLLSQAFLLLQLPLAVALLIINAAVGGCIPAWILLITAYLLIFTIVNAVNLASRNNLISVVAGAYRDARRDIRTAILSLPPSAALEAELQRHDAAVGSFLDVDRYSAKILGFTVTYGGVRTGLATLVTLAVALWSVARSLGVVLTMESFCPTVA